MDAVQLWRFAGMVRLPDLSPTCSNSVRRRLRLQAVPPARLRQPARLGVESITAPVPDNPHAAWWFLQSSGTPAREAKGHALAHIQKAVPTGCSARRNVSWRRDVH